MQLMRRIRRIRNDLLIEGALNVINNIRSEQGSIEAEYGISTNNGTVYGPNVVAGLGVSSNGNISAVGGLSGSELEVFGEANITGPASFNSLATFQDDVEVNGNMHADGSIISDVFVQSKQGIQAGKGPNQVIITGSTGVVHASGDVVAAGGVFASDASRFYDDVRVDGDLFAEGEIGTSGGTTNFMGHIAATNISASGNISGKNVIGQDLIIESQKQIYSHLDQSFATISWANTILTLNGFTPGDAVRVSGYFVWNSGASVGGIKLAVESGSGSDPLSHLWVANNNATTSNAAPEANGTYGGAEFSKIPARSDGSVENIYYEGVFMVGNAGEFTVRAAKAQSSATNTVLMTGSWLKVEILKPST